MKYGEKLEGAWSLTEWKLEYVLFIDFTSCLQSHSCDCTLFMTYSNKYTNRIWMRFSCVLFSFAENHPSLPWMAPFNHIYSFFFLSPFQGQLSTVGYSQVFALVSKILSEHVCVCVHMCECLSVCVWELPSFIFNFAVFIQQILCNLLTKSRPWQLGQMWRDFRAADRKGETDGCQPWITLYKGADLWRHFFSDDQTPNVES